MTAPELKPCPFCGGGASISKDHDPDGNGAFYAVKCHKCRAKSSEIYAVETCNIHFTQVRDAWNRRTDLSQAAVAAARAEDAELIAASFALKEIVEGISGAMDHGTFRAENGMRLKDTPEWVAFYVAIRALITPAQHDALAAANARADQALVEAGYTARNACLVPPDGGSPSEDERLVCEEAERRILALRDKPTIAGGGDE